MNSIYSKPYGGTPTPFFHRCINKKNSSIFDSFCVDFLHFFRIVIHKSHKNSELFLVSFIMANFNKRTAATFTLMLNLALVVIYLQPLVECTPTTASEIATEDNKNGKKKI